MWREFCCKGSPSPHPLYVMHPSCPLCLSTERRKRIWPFSNFKLPFTRISDHPWNGSEETSRGHLAEKGSCPHLWGHSWQHFVPSLTSGCLSFHPILWLLHPPPSQCPACRHGEAWRQTLSLPPVTPSLPARSSRSQPARTVPPSHCYGNIWSFQGWEILRDFRSKALTSL